MKIQKLEWREYVLSDSWIGSHNEHDVAEIRCQDSETNRWFVRFLDSDAYITTNDSVEKIQENVQKSFDNFILDAIVEK